MNHEQIMATERKIAYVDNTGGSVSADPILHSLVLAAVHADTTELPDDIADLFTLSYVRISDIENRAILNWA